LLKGLLRLWCSINGDTGKGNSLPMITATSISIIYPEPSQPYSLLNCFFRTKKGERYVFVRHFYGRFLSINIARTAPTKTIATMIPTIAGTKYKSATDWGGVVDDGAVEVGGSLTVM
jgi:hypothetical protein